MGMLWHTLIMTGLGDLRWYQSIKPHVTLGIENYGYNVTHLNIIGFSDLTWY